MEQIDLLRRLAEVLNRRRLPYMLVGSLASSAYGEPRMTQDIDVVVRLPLTEVDGFCSEFPVPEYYVSVPAAKDAVLKGRQFNIIHTLTANKIDIMVPLPSEWENSQLSRRQRISTLGDTDVFAAAPEDVIVSKLRYFQEGGSEKHLRDIGGIVRVSGNELDRKYLESWIAKLGLQTEWAAVEQRLKSP